MKRWAVDAVSHGFGGYRVQTTIYFRWKWTAWVHSKTIGYGMYPTIVIASAPRLCEYTPNRKKQKGWMIHDKPTY